MPRHGPSNPTEGILAPLAGDLCRIVNLNFREYLFHALR
jgi:hypothetical protein